MRIPGSKVLALLQDIILRNENKSRYVQLATHGLDGFPSVRTVVQRGFLESTDESRLLLKFVTDRRSQKIQELQASHNVEACWYFASHEQLRLKGTMQAVFEPGQEPDSMKNSTEHVWVDAREQSWLKDLSARARGSFLNDAPGTALPVATIINIDSKGSSSEGQNTPENAHQSSSEPLLEAGDPQEAEAKINFVLLVLDVITIDYVDLRVSSRQRFLRDSHTAEHDVDCPSSLWEVVNVNP